MADSPVAAYQVKQSGGAFKLVGKSYGTAPYGIAIPKGNGHGQRPSSPRLKRLIADGTYSKILTKWGIQAGRDHQPGDQRRDQLERPMMSSR